MRANNATLTMADFFGAFFPDENETICLRTFKPKDAPSDLQISPKKSETNRKKIQEVESIAELKKANQYSGVYFVVNSGGHSDSEIRRYNAFFAENDNRSLEEQHSALDNAPILPSIRVKTKKSIHAYWLIDGDCSEEDWREIQIRLIQHFGSDEKIKNPSRCMRVPFLNHVSFDDDKPQYVKVEIESFDSEKKFTCEEMKSAFLRVEMSKESKVMETVTTVTRVTTSEQKFETWNELNAELGLRIIQHSSEVRSNGNYQMRCPVHNGQTDDSLFFNPMNKVICCTNGCEHSDILRAFGLPTKPDLSLKSNESKVSQSGRILEITKQVEFFVNQEEEPFACIKINGCQENCPVDSKTFKEWVRKTYYETFKEVPNENALTDALGTLAGKAKYEGEKKQVFIRRAELDDAIFLDLANDKRQVVKITENGWEIISDCPIKFRRVGTQKPLPLPEKGGSLQEVDQFLNVRKEDLALVKAWLVTALRTNIPYPILIFSGQMNCGKSTSAKVICELIDPNLGELLSNVKNDENLFIAANNRVIVPLDNISFVSESLSDMLCGISTGSSFTKRKNYSDTNEIILKAKNPILITGIGDIATREDFLSRCVILDLPVLQRRIDDSTFWADFYKALPRIFGALLDTVSESLKEVKFVKAEDTDLRMLDFARLGTSIEKCLALSEGKFIQIYRENYKNVKRLILDSNITVTLLMKFMNDKPEWLGTATELYDHLNKLTNYLNQKRFPKSPIGLSNTLERLGKNLLTEGIDIDRRREGGTGRKLILIKNLGFSSSQSSQSSQLDTEQQPLCF